MLIKMNESRDLTPVIDFDSLVIEWLDYEQTFNEASDNTINTYRVSIAKYNKWLSDNSLTFDFVTPADIAQFKADLKAAYSVQTTNLRLTAVRSFYRFCVATNKAAYNPASEVKGAKRSKSKKHKRDALSVNEVKGVLSQPDITTLQGMRDKAILTLFAYCALRGIEIHRANIGDVKTREDRLTLDVQGKGDSGKNDFVVIPLSQESFIREYLSARIQMSNNGQDAPLFPSFSNRNKGGRMSMQAIRAMVKNYFQQAGVVEPGKTTHSLRHSAITNAIRAGAEPLQVQKMARHQSFDTTLNYYHETNRIDNPAEDFISY